MDQLSFSVFKNDNNVIVNIVRQTEMTEQRTANIMYKKLPVHRVFKGFLPQQAHCILTGIASQTATFHTRTVSGHRSETIAHIGNERRPEKSI